MTHDMYAMYASTDQNSPFKISPMTSMRRSVLVVNKAKYILINSLYNLDIDEVLSGMKKYI